ncbi:MAG: ABC transporter permease [Ruminococcus sp.]|nr:ABC transporter permease [Ruminococcus sp.]HOO05090.1 ABC transporter permease [Ruminococcus sp.]
MKTKKIGIIVLGLILPAAILLLWYFSTNFTSTPESILPRISTVGRKFREMIQTGQLQEDLGISLGRVLKGFVLAALFGILVGSIVGMSETAKRICLPTITAIRQIPIIAWVPLIILWCGIGEASKVVIIVMAAFFPIMVNTMSGMIETPKGYVEVAKLYKLSRLKTFTKVYLPHALPNILVGLKLGLGVSWMAVVAAELIASLSGIGYRMSNARSLMQSDTVIVCMLVIGVVGIIMDKLISIVFSLLTPWQKSNNK